MTDLKAKDERKELWDAFDNQHYQRIEQFNKQFKILDDVNNLLEISLPQYLDSVVDAIKTALDQMDPTWQMGQFRIFSKHFQTNLVRSFFTGRFPLTEAKYLTFSNDKILEFILEAPQGFSNAKNAAFYGKVLSEYLLLCPTEIFPSWAESYKDKPSFIIVWNSHYTISMTISH